MEEIERAMNAASVKVLAGPLLGILAYAIFPGSGSIALVAGVAVWMAIWWMTEAVNIYFTALLPLMLFPLLGIASMTTVAPQYTKEIIFLFIGGFLIAFGLERWNLHKRIALRLILLVGATPTGILTGFVLASYLLSMWISNTATVTMLLPALMAVISQLDDQRGGQPSALAPPLLLGLAYGASIGGMATIVGTPPNLIFMSFFNERFGDPQITFANWMAFGVPLSLLLLVVCLLVLRLLFQRAFRGAHIDIEYCRREYHQLGRFTYQEKAVSVVFGVTVLLWFFMKDLSFGVFTIPGWTSFPPFSAY
ncbi:MAG: SLC13 family permease, partial [Bacteroidota bacterium]